MHEATLVYGVNAVLKSARWVTIAAGVLTVHGSDIPLLIGAEALGVLAGLVGITPAGIGVREAVIAGVLRVRFGFADAFALAVIARGMGLRRRAHLDRDRVGAGAATRRPQTPKTERHRPVASGTHDAVRLAGARRTDARRERVLPVYNEAGHLRAEVDRIEACARRLAVLVRDHRRRRRVHRRIARRARRPRGERRHPGRSGSPENRGSGSARKAGTRPQRDAVVVWTDVDMTYPNDQIPELVKELDGYDQVVGARTSEQGTHKRRGCRRSGSSASWPRTSPRPIPDLNSGFRAFRRDVGLQYVSQLPAGFSCVTTITMTFLANGYTVKYVPIEYARAAGALEVPLVERHPPLPRAGRSARALLQPAARLPAHRCRGHRARRREARLRLRRQRLPRRRRTPCSSCSRRSRCSQSDCLPTSSCGSRSPTPRSSRLRSSDRGRYISRCAAITVDRSCRVDLPARSRVEAGAAGLATRLRARRGRRG